MFDYSKLDGKITECFGTRKNFAKAMRGEGIKMSDHTLSVKMNNIVSWKQTEIDAACNLLGISLDDVAVYFFAKKVQSVEHSDQS